MNLLKVAAGKYIIGKKNAYPVNSIYSPNHPEQFTGRDH